MAKDLILFLDDCRGIYIPRDFAESIKPEFLSGVDADDLETLKAGPDAEFYWEAWESVLNSAVVTDTDGDKYSVHQDGICWLVPQGMEWSDHDGWIWPVEDDDDGEDSENGEVTS